MNDRAPHFHFVSLNMCLLEYQCQLQKQSKDKSETPTMNILKRKISSPDLILFHIHVINSILLESTVSWQADYY